MKKNKSFLSALLVMLFIVNGFRHAATGQTTRVEGKWSGTVSMYQKYKGITGWSEKWIDVSFKDNVGSGTIKYQDELIVEGKSLGKGDCFGVGSVELWAVEIYRPDSTYVIETIGPTCSGGSNPWEAGHGNDIQIADIHWDGNPNFLSGTDTKTAQIPGDLGTMTTTLSWSLYKGPIDAQLIITPNAYNIWMPKATKDELKKGSDMNIDLKVQGRNGGVSSLKAVRFELRLSNTSREKGTTLNMPPQPSANQLPDIRFLPHAIAESIDEDQYIEIPCTDGKTGTATIASYDGGGWTTLTAVAVLEGGFRIEGTLLTPTGIKEIPIPKRNGTSKIATAWLNANGNPGETNDTERKTGNPNIGDGLTAYEEYRGVISEAEFGNLDPNKFGRLDPQKKELGIMATKANHSLFAEGVRWFESASGLKVIRFDETEIVTDRKFNRNFGHANVYEQYVLKIENGPTTKSAAGENRPITLEFMIPRQSDLVVVNVDWIEKFHHIQDSVMRAEGSQMPYTKNDLLASTVAHELAHGVNVNHHGKPSITPQNRIAYEDSHPSYHIFNTIPPGTEIPASTWRFDAALGKRSYLIEGITGTAGNEESGDLSCFMAYTSNYQWAFRTSNTDGSLYYYRVPVLPVGKKLCSSKTGTGINAASVRGINNVNKYFGDAGPAPDEGNCLIQIKLRD